MKRLLFPIVLISLSLLLVGCSAKTKPPQEDPTSKTMRESVAGSAARASARVNDWEVKPERNQYWATVSLTNVGGQGEIAIRTKIRAMVPYVGINEGASEPQYVTLAPGESTHLQCIGKLSAKFADKAIGCDVEVYPK